MKKVLSLLFIMGLLLLSLVGCPPTENTTNLLEAVGYGNIAVVFILALIVIVCVLLLQTKYKAQAAKLLLYLVTTAEKEFGSGTGQLKYSAVATWLYEKLPSLAKLILTSSTIDALIEAAVTQMKKYLEANESAKTIVEKANATITARAISPVVNITTSNTEETADKIVEALKKATSAITG